MAGFKEKQGQGGALVQECAQAKVFGTIVGFMRQFPLRLQLVFGLRSVASQENVQERPRQILPLVCLVWASFASAGGSPQLKCSLSLGGMPDCQTGEAKDHSDPCLLVNLPGTANNPAQAPCK